MYICARSYAQYDLFLYEFPARIFRRCSFRTQNNRVAMTSTFDVRLAKMCICYVISPPAFTNQNSHKREEDSNMALLTFTLHPSYMYKVYVLSMRPVLIIIIYILL